MAGTFGVGRSDSVGNPGLPKPAGILPVRGLYIYWQKEGHWKRDCEKGNVDEVKEMSEPPTIGRNHGGVEFMVVYRTLEVVDHRD